MGLEVCQDTPLLNFQQVSDSSLRKTFGFLQLKQTFLLCFCIFFSRDPRVTIRRQSEGRINLELCKNCNLYHCPFCKTSVYKPKADYGSVWTHIEIHRIRAVKHGGQNIKALNTNISFELIHSSFIHVH